MTARPHVRLMSRRGCCLCDEAKTLVEAAAADGLCDWEVVDVDADKTLLLRYGQDVPVLLINGEKCFQHSFAAADLRAVLMSEGRGKQEAVSC